MEDQIKGDLSSYFNKDEDVQYFSDVMETYMNIPYATSFPELKRGKVKFLFDENKDNILTFAPIYIRAFISSYVYGKDMYGTDKDSKVWSNKLRSCKWTLFFGENLSLTLEEGCISAKSNTDKAKECDLLCVAISTIPDIGIFDLVVVPKETCDCLVEKIRKSNSIVGIFIDPVESNKESISKMFKNKKIQRIGLLKGASSNENTIAICTWLVMDQKQPSNELSVIDIPVKITGKDQIRRISKKFPNLLRISAYSATDAEAVQVKGLFDDAYDREDIVVERRT